MPYKEGRRWRASVMRKGMRHTALEPTKKAAQEWESMKRKELKKDERISRKGMDLLSFCGNYLDFSMRFSQKTYDEKRSTVKQFIKYIGPDTSVIQISPDMCQSYLDKQAKTRSNNASNKDRKNIMAMWNWGIEFKGLKNNPFKPTKKRSHDKQTLIVPTVEEIIKLLMVCTRKERVIITAYLHTGARRSEVFRWTWHEDISFNDRTARIGTRKTKDGSIEYRWVEMSDGLSDQLRWWYKNRTIPESPYVFTDDQPGPHYGKPYKARRRFMKGLCKRADIREFGFHSLRRFFASLLADQKEDIKTIQKLLGHSRPTTTDRYLYSIGKGKTEKAIEKISLKLNLHEGLTRKQKGANGKDR